MSTNESKNSDDEKSPSVFNRRKVLLTAGIAFSSGIVGVDEASGAENAIVMEDALGVFEGDISKDKFASGYNDDSSKLTGWPLPRRDVSNTGHAPSGQSPPSAEKLSKRWEFSTENEGMATPLVDGEMVLASSSYPDGDLYKLNLRTGSSIWELRHDAIQSSDPVFGQGSIFAAFANPTEHTRILRKFDKNEGTEQELDFDLGFPTDMIATSGTLLIAHSRTDGRVEVVGIDPSIARIHWRYQPPISNGAIADIALHDGILYVGGDDTETDIPTVGSVSATDIKSGKTKWAIVAKFPVESLAVSSDGVYVTTRDAVFALDLETGELMWSGDREGGSTVPAVGSNTVYIGDRFQLKAFDTSTGEVEWTTPLSGFRARPSIGGDTVYVSVASSVNQPAKLVALDSTTGEKIWKTSFNQLEITPPTIADDGVFVGEDGGTVYRYS